MHIKSKQISKFDTCFYIHFRGLFKNKVFRSVSLVIKKLWAKQFSYGLCIKKKKILQNILKISIYQK